MSKKIPNKMENLALLKDKKKKDARRIRKRLSVSEANGQSPLLLDGYRQNTKKEPMILDSFSDNESNETKSDLFKSYAMKTKVGIIPFNPSKVNQDRAIMIPVLPNSSQKAALFGVFDGHGMQGHDVSSYLMNKMPQWYSDNKYWIKDPNKSLHDCFSWLTESLQKSDVNCTFSGTTAVVCCVGEKHIYTANVGDSRAILAREVQGKLKAISLSFDQKPNNSEEKARIEKHNGRVEPCKGPMDEFIGPHRVWLKYQDMPGLAMSRSFGDDVAASVGVITVPEIIIKQRTKSDKFIVIASDGIWEFLSNSDVVEIVSKFTDVKQACRALCKEATKQWQQEEDVIDDITAVIVYF